MHHPIKRTNAKIFVGQREVVSNYHFQSPSLNKNDTESFLRRNTSASEGRPAPASRCKSAPKASSNSTRPLNKSSSCTGFACLARQQELHFPPETKSAWEEKTEYRPPEPKKITVILPKTHKKKVPKPIDNVYFNGLLSENNKNKEKLIDSQPSNTTLTSDSIGSKATSEQKVKDKPMMQQVPDLKSSVDETIRSATEENVTGPISVIPTNSEIDLERDPDAKEPDILQRSKISKSVIEHENKDYVTETNDDSFQIVTHNESADRNALFKKTDVVKSLKAPSTLTVEHIENANLLLSKNVQRYNPNPHDKIRTNIRNDSPLQEIFTVIPNSGLPETPRKLRSKQRFSGYKPRGQTAFMPFTQMFTKPMNQLNPSDTCFPKTKENSNTGQQDVKLNLGIESLTPKDKDTIQRTRQLLRQQVEKKDVRKTTSTKIPLSIVLTPQRPACSNVQDMDDIIFQTIEQRNGSPPELVNTRLPIVLSDNFRGSIDNNKNIINPVMCSAVKKSKNTSTIDIHTQVSRASPVSSDVEILPVDILDSKNTKSSLERKATESRLIPSSQNSSNSGQNIPEKVFTSTEDPRVQDALIYSEDDGEDILSPSSGDTSRNSFNPSPPQVEESFNNHRYQMVTDSRSSSRRSSIASVSGHQAGQTRHQTRPDSCRPNTKGRGKPPSRRQRSSPVVYLPDRRCFAGVQEALALQARLARAQVTVSINTLLRGLLSPPQYRQLQLCPVLKVYAGC